MARKVTGKTQPRTFSNGRTIVSERGASAKRARAGSPSKVADLEMQRVSYEILRLV